MVQLIMVISDNYVSLPEVAWQSNPVLGPLLQQLESGGTRMRFSLFVGRLGPGEEPKLGAELCGKFSK